MRIRRLQVSQIRNLGDQEIEFDGGLNLLMGANGQGKSSLLESVYLLGTTRSFRTSKLAEVVRIGGGPARVGGEGEGPGERLAVLIARNERRYLRHGKQVSAAQYIGTMDVVALSNELVQGFRRKPAERRRFLDRMALATWPGYLTELSDLRRACAQRAILAASGVRGGERKAWDERSAALAIPVVKRRHEMASQLAIHLRAASRTIFPEGAGSSVRVVSNPVYQPGREDEYVAKLAALYSSQDPSPGRRETPYGPPRDDLSVEIEGRDLLRYGSAGQVRSLLTSSVLAEMNRLKDLKGRFPVLVLDDVDADLDEGRYAALLSGVGAGAQVFAATSKPAMAGRLVRGGRRFTVSEGLVTTV